MAVELKIPTVGESITEVHVGNWLKKSGDYVERDEPVVEIESDKATVEIFAPVSGVISDVLKDTGDTAEVGEVIGHMEEKEAPAGEEKEEASKKEEKEPVAVGAKKTKKKAAKDKGDGKAKRAKSGEAAVMPAAKRLLSEHGLEPDDVEATGPGGRLLKEDVLRFLEEEGEEKPGAEAPRPSPSGNGGAREEDIVPMSPMRKRIAQRLVSAQQTAALLTTFNEVDMSEIVALRNAYKEAYLEKYGIKLGFMSFFVKACIEALKEFPQVNAEVRDTDIVYRNYYDIGIAVGGGKGLVVPVLRNAERMSFAEIEVAIDDFGRRAAKNKIELEELTGGTFTISNGGIYGSMLSTPIINPPQSGILGMHKIEERPVALNGEVVIRPMMYLALSYDHRIVDGREAVTFLVRIKECLEQPSRILLEV